MTAALGYKYEWVLTSGWQLNVEQVIKNSKQRAVGLVN